MYACEKGIQIVFKFVPSSDVLFAVQRLVISSDVISGLMAAYQLEKTGPGAMAVSSAT